MNGRVAMGDETACDYEWQKKMTDDDTQHDTTDDHPHTAIVQHLSKPQKPVFGNALPGRALAEFEWGTERKKAPHSLEGYIESSPP